MQKSTRHLAASASLIAALGLVLPATAATATPHQARTHGARHTVLVQTDSLSGNRIVIYDRARDGSLTRAGSYRTGGLGGQAAGSVVDHLASQGSLVYESHQHTVLAVNAGSDSLSVFTLRGDRLTRCT